MSSSDNSRRTDVMCEIFNLLNAGRNLTKSINGKTPSINVQDIVSQIAGNNSKREELVDNFDKIFANMFSRDSNTSDSDLSFSSIFEDIFGSTSTQGRTPVDLTDDELDDIELDSDSDNLMIKALILLATKQQKELELTQNKLYDRTLSLKGLEELHENLKKDYKSKDNEVTRLRNNFNDLGDEIADLRMSNSKTVADLKRSEEKHSKLENLITGKGSVTEKQRLMKVAMGLEVVKKTPPKKKVVTTIKRKTNAKKNP